MLYQFFNSYWLNEVLQKIDQSFEMEMTAYRTLDVEENLPRKHLESSRFQYSPFPFLDRCLIYFPSYISHGRSKRRNIVCLVLIIVAILAFDSEGAWFFIAHADAYSEPRSFLIASIICLSFTTNIFWQLFALHFMTTKLPKISKILFNRNNETAAHVKIDDDDDNYNYNLVWLRRKTFCLALFLLAVYVSVGILSIIFHIIESNFQTFSLILYPIYITVSFYFVFIPQILMVCISSIILHCCKFKIDNLKSKIGLLCNVTSDTNTKDINGNINVDINAGIAKGIIDNYLEIFDEFGIIFKSLQYWFACVLIAVVINLWMSISIIVNAGIENGDDSDDSDDSDDGGTGTNNSGLNLEWNVLYWHTIIDWSHSTFFGIINSFAILYPCILIGKTFDDLKQLINNKIDKNVLPQRLQLLEKKDIMMNLNNNTHGKKMNLLNEILIIYSRLDRLTDIKPLYVDMFGISIHKQLVIQLVLTFLVTRCASLAWDQL